MPDFGEDLGPFISNVLRSVKEQAERLPYARTLLEKLKEFDPSPEQIHELAQKCAEGVTVVGRALADIVENHQQSEPGSKMPEHIDIPDDLSDFDK